jgi:hypothetical protein
MAIGSYYLNVNTVKPIIRRFLDNILTPRSQLRCMVDGVAHLLFKDAKYVDKIFTSQCFLFLKQINRLPIVIFSTKNILELFTLIV